MLIASQSVFATSPECIQLGEDLDKLCKLMNSINERCAGEILPNAPWVHAWCRGHFLLEQKDMNSKFELKPDPTFLRRVVQR
jgi:hypothetical protein